MSNKNSTIIKFRLSLDDTQTAMDLHDRFFPNGQQVLNRTEWRGKEPRSCAVTNYHASFRADDKIRVAALEVTYRPKGCITFLGGTRYDGWTAMMLDKAEDGTLLDGHGKPLQLGQEKVYLPFEVYHDIDFNDIDFGEFIGEVNEGEIQRVAYDEVMRQVHASSRVNVSLHSTFTAPRRQRPEVRIIVSEFDFSPMQGGVGLRTLMINKNDPQSREVILDSVYEAMAGFLEGRYSLKTITTNDLEFVELSGLMMELKPANQKIDSVFNVFSHYVSSSDVEELAKRLMSVYEVDVKLVEGETVGLLISRLKPSTAV